MSVIIETTIGDLIVDLFVKERPRACLNFLKLCKIKYYNFHLFHKVESNFIAQTGDPSGTGRGGESIFSKLYGDQARFFEAETNPRIKHKKLGTLSMVNDGDNMHASQFFITLAEELDYLDNNHTVFGEVAEGFDVLEKFNEAICDDNSRPYQDIRISHTIILDDPFDDPKGLEIPDHSPKPTKEMLENSRIGADEEIDDTKGKSLEDIEEEIQEKEATARATILEMVGDLPEAEVKPEDNVLFVCKLNPVTTDEDLQIIFSRFGKIISCEVIKDKKSGESLQYAFIEFSNPSECESAYFKMDNVLIDDRRIHVDFSQSVAHLTWKKRKGKIPEEKESIKPKFKIKNSIRNNEYDLVPESFNKNESSSSRTKKKDKKKRSRRSSSESSSDSSDDQNKGSRNKYKKSYDNRDSSDHKVRHRHDGRSTEREKYRKDKSYSESRKFSSKGKFNERESYDKHSHSGHHRSKHASSNHRRY